MRRFRLIAGTLAALWSTAAFAQNVQYVSPVTRNHIPVWNTNGVIADGGSSADSPISSIGITNNGGAGFCVNSDRITAAGRQQLCFGASTAGAATISLQNYGTATAQNLNFVVNGTIVTLPTGGAAFALENPPFVANHASCFVSSAGVLQDCGVAIGAGTQWGVPYYSTTSQVLSTPAGTNGQAFIGQTGAAPAWKTLSGDVGSISAAGAVTLQAVNGIPFASTYTAHGVLLGQGTSQFVSSSSSSIGSCFVSQGAGADPIWASCGSVSGGAGGLNTQVQYNNATSLAGSANLTWVSPTLTVGVAGSTTGQVGLASSTATGTVTLQAPGVSTSYNFNYPTGAGSTGQPLISGGGGATNNTFGTLGIFGGGTNCSTASGTCLDNITSWASTGYVYRSGGGTYAFSTIIPVTGGGTGLGASGTSGGILGYTGAGTLASSAQLTQYGLVVGGGAGATPTAITPGTSAQLLIQQTGANPSWNSMSSDATISSSGALTIANSAVTVAKQANAAAYSIEGNFTGSSAAPQFSTIGALTQKASPATTDLIMIQDQAAAGQIKYATVASISSAGSVSSIAGNTGSFTVAAGVTNSVNQIMADGNYFGFATSNCTIAASVGSNLLTVALKDNAGSDPSATSPCNINYRSLTAATGTTTSVPQTSALSVATTNTGTAGSLGAPSSSTPFRFWVVVFNNAGTNVLALINCTGASQIFPLNEDAVASSTPFGAGATSAGVFYTPSGTTIATKAFRILGYVEWGTGLTTAGTYASGPTVIQLFGPGQRKPGEPVQRIYAQASGTTTSSSVSYVASTLAKNFTKASAANPVRVDVSVTGLSAAGTGSGYIMIPYRGNAACTTVITSFPTGGSSAAAAATVLLGSSVTGIDMPAASGSTTAQYTLCFAALNGFNVTVPYLAAYGNMILEEIMG